jgi:hypothetical protein
VAVGVQGDANGRRAEALGHDLRMGPRCQPNGGIGVADVVETNHGHPCPAGEVVKAPGDRVGPERRPVFPAEHQVEIAVDLLPGDPFLVLGITMMPESSQCGRVDGDAPAGLGRLRGREGDLPSHRAEGLADSGSARLKVEVRPAQPEQLASPEARGGDQQPGCVEAVALDNDENVIGSYPSPTAG